MKETARNLWMYREHTRIQTNVYKGIIAPILGRRTIQSILNEKEATLNHFLHVSTEDNKMVAYTPSDEYGIQNRKIRIKFGRYLQNFFSNVLSPDDIRDYAAAYREAVSGDGLLLARKADDIEWVYENGPESCMRGKDWEKYCGQHPCRLYAMSEGGVIAVAYMYRGERITARAVVHTENKVWTRIYGDEIALSRKLTSAGYEPGNIDGTKFPVILLENGNLNRFLMPYIDNSNQRYTVSENVITIDNRGDEQSKSTVGEGTICTDIVCGNCGETVDGDCVTTMSDDVTACDNCVDEYYRHTIIDIDGNTSLRNLSTIIHIEVNGNYYDDTLEIREYYGIVWSEYEDAYLIGSESATLIDGTILHHRNAMPVTLADGTEGYVATINKLTTHFFVLADTETSIAKYFLVTSREDIETFAAREDLISAVEYIDRSIKTCMETINIKTPYIQLRAAKVIALLESDYYLSEPIITTLLQGIYYEGKYRRIFIQEARSKLLSEIRRASTNPVCATPTSETA